MDVKCQNRQRLYTIEDLENLLEYVPYEIWLKDKDGRHVYINLKGANKLGLKKEDIIGKTDMEIRSKELWEKLAWSRHSKATKLFSINPNV